MVLVNRKRKYISILFIIYISVVLIITQLPLHFGFGFHLTNIRTNFIPFGTITKALDTIKQNSILGGKYISPFKILLYIIIVSKNFFINIIIFMPFGFLTPIIKVKFDRLYKVAIVGFSFSLIIEVFQVLSMVFLSSYSRVFDIDDLIANTLGSVFGYMIYKIISRYRKSINQVIDKNNFANEDS